MKNNTIKISFFKGVITYPSNENLKTGHDLKMIFYEFYKKLVYVLLFHK